MPKRTGRGPLPWFRAHTYALLLLGASACGAMFAPAVSGAAPPGASPPDSSVSTSVPPESAPPESVTLRLSPIIVRPDSTAAPSESPAEVLTEAEIRRTSGTADDVFRAVQSSPGLATTDLSASFMVRGGESDETLVRFDDFDLLEPYHIRDWGGAVSIVSLDAVGSARLERGGLPARYGRHLSGALEIQSPREPIRRPRLEVGAGLTQVRGLATGPIAGGGSYLLGARYGLLSALQRLRNFDHDAAVDPDFEDLIAEARFKPGPKDEFVLLALGAREKLRYDEPFDENDIRGTIRNVTLGASWSIRPSPGVRHRAVLSADRFNRLRTLGRTGRDDGLTRALRGRFESELPLAGGYALELGTAAEYEEALVHLEAIRASVVGASYDEALDFAIHGRAARRRVEAFVSLRSRFKPGGVATLGINASRDFYSWALRSETGPVAGMPGFAFLSPRLALSARLGTVGTGRLSLGLTRQPVFLNNLSEERGALPLGRKREAAEAIVGFDTDVAGLTVRTEGYLRSERGAGIPIQDVGTHPALATPLDRGSSRGVEVQLETPRWKRGDFRIGFALSRAVWSTPQGDVPRSFDQPLAANAALNLRPSGLWNLNASARWHTGTPYTPTEWVSVDGHRDWTRQIGAFMSRRYPYYFRLDLRLSHPLPIGRPGGNLYFEVINATGWENVHMYTHAFAPHPDGDGTVPLRRVVELFPRVPSVGFEVSF
jgi:hypothetical protein